MSREWKPGDVGFYDGLRVFYTEGDEFVDSEGDTREGDAFNARPLVVIDAEDDAQMSRLSDLIAGWSGRSVSVDGLSVKDTHVAIVRDILREFANPTPPKPAEPTGLGAVVEDADGAKWILVYDHSMWQRHDNRAVWRYFSEIDAVRVLSEGVTQ